MATPLPVITRGFRVANNMQTADGTCTNVFWLTAGVGMNENDVALGFQRVYFDVTAGPTIASLQSSNLQMINTEVTALDGTTPTIVVPYPALSVGLVVGQSAPINCALVLTWTTGQRGIAHRGRTFLPGIPSASIETGSGRWNSALIADATTWIQTWLDNMLSAPEELALMVVSQHAATSPTHDPVTGFTPRQGIGTQRRRTERQKP